MVACPFRALLVLYRMLPVNTEYEMHTIQNALTANKMIYKLIMQ